MSTDVGSLIIQLQGAVEGLDFRSDDERRVFLQQYGKHLPEKLRQCLLTWRANQMAPRQGE